ncbi:MAG: T9SS type A sorting domain-containing protein [Bacteroidetes bacterium]|nr:T9SS type A sorting domain-containing protein [Bacteroidota bacterium]MBS1941990.1 T9SS type A sorting domain-containing protein [Bacteroidota bacterium]
MPPYQYAWSNGQTIFSNQEDIVLPIGGQPISVAVYDQLGNYSVLDVNVGIPAVITSTPCSGPPSGAIDITLPPGFVDPGFQWYDSDNTLFATTEDIDGLGAGSYDLYVYDNQPGGCSLDMNFTITSLPEITGTTTVSTSGWQCEVGEIDLTPSGGTAPYSFVWSQGETTEDIQGAESGFYSVVITDASGCTGALANIFIPTAPIMELSATVTATPSCGAGGAIDLTVTGGVAPYSYLWSPSQSTEEDPTGLFAGSHYVVVTDATGCTTSAVFTVPGTASTLAASGNLTSPCSGGHNGLIDLIVSGGTPPYTYEWGGSNGLSAITEDVTDLEAGNYWCIVTDAIGCTEIPGFSLLNGAQALSLSASTTPTCTDFGAIDLTVTGTNGPFTFNWDYGYGPTTEDVSNLHVGYAYTVEVTDITLGCTATGIFTVPPVDPGDQPQIVDHALVQDCNGTDVSVTATGNYQPLSFFWQGDIGSNSPNAEGLIDVGSGSYVCAVTDAVGCMAWQVIEVPPGPALELDLWSSTPCSSTLSVFATGGTGAYTYSWSNGATTYQFPDATPGQTYSVTVQDQGGLQCSATASFEMPNIQPIDITGVNMYTCDGSQNGSIDLTVTGPPGDYSFEWSGPGGFTSTSEDITDLWPGLYSYMLTGTYAGCGIVGWFEIDDLPSPTLYTTPYPTCGTDANGSVELAVSGSIPPFSYEWTGPGGFTSTIEDPTGLAAGTYMVTVTSAPPGSCKVTTTCTVGTNPAITLSAVSTPTCSMSGSIDLTPGGGSGWYTFQWEGPGGYSSTTEDPSGLAAGTYTVTVTDAVVGCQASADYIVGINPAITLGATSIPTCNSGTSGSINLTASGGTGPFTFLWSGPNGFTSSEEDLLGLVSGTYTVNVTDAVGCTQVNDVMVGNTVIQTDPVIADAACTSGNLGAIDITPSGGVGPYSFSWSNGATSEDISGLQEGSYTVFIQDANGCSAQQTFNVADTSPCCPADLYIPDGAVSTTYGTEISNTTMDILGQFLIDGQLTITNCTVYMEPGAEIIVLPGGALRMGGCTVGSCTEVMWKSITASEGSYVHLSGCTVRDAENVVTALNGATVRLGENQFIDDRTALFVPADPDDAFNYSDVLVSMAGNLFTSTGTLAAPYPGQTTPVGNVGYAAVDARQTAFLSLTGGGNIIDNMSNGIVGHRSNLEVSGFTMNAIQPDPAYAYEGNGSAIYALGDHGDFKLNQQGYGIGTVNFRNCKWGLYTEYMTVYSEQNYMQDVDVGYHVEKSGHRYVSLLENRIEAHYDGIDLLFNEGAFQVLVQNNDITFGDVPNGAPPTKCSAILVNEGNVPSEDSRILNNTIHFAANLSAYTGIYMRAANRWLVAENYLYMASNALNSYGILTNGCTDFEVSCNHVNGAANNYINNRQTAIYNNMGEAGLFSCNVMDQTTNGMLFNGYAYGTEMRGNQYHQHKWGLHLGPSAIIGTQSLKGNLWYDPPAAGGLSAWYEPIVAGQPNPNASNNQFLYNPAIINGGNTEPPSVDPAPGWFSFVDGENYDCANDQGADYCSQFYAVRSNGVNGLDQQIAQDSLQNDPYTPETQWTLKGGLYGKLDNNPALRDSLPDMAAFYNDLQGSATAAFKAVGDGQLALYGLDSTVVAQLQANRVQIESYMALVKTGMEGLNDSTLTAAQADSIIASLSGYRQNINTLVAWNTSAMEVARTSKALTADGLKAANAAIGTSKLIEANEKQVNEIYLSVIAKEVDTFTVDQANTLYSIASQCPMEGGNAVYQARSMYRLINDTVFFDDQLICLQHGIIVKSIRQQDPNRTGVIPNPAKDRATLMMEQPLDNPGTFVLYNMLGTVVFHLDVAANAFRTDFSTTGIAQGMYHYRVISTKGVVGSGKLSIIH